ncbi:endoglucanase E-4 [Biomphalaria glabrata]|nr:endoglucanase E-4 [Biomphalaria glabrata]
MIDWSLLFLLILHPALICVAETPISILGHWSGGFQGQACIPITKELDGWKAHILFSEDVDSLDIWVAVATKISPREYLIENTQYKTQEHVGDRLCFTFIGHGLGDIVPTASVYVEGMDEPVGLNTTHVPTGPTTSPGPTHALHPVRKNYTDALGKSILFYEAQRSGKLPANNRVPWRGDSALNDCVPGGWYDAGDHVKFGLPMASTTTVLLWSILKFKDGYVQSGQLNNAMDQVKWTLDYFLKGWNPQTKQLVAQVGDGRADHSYWGRPEDMTMPRPCQFINETINGSDIAAETAAALAAGSIAFKENGDAAYSTQLLTAAESLYSFAKTHRGVFKGSATYYSSRDEKDELCMATLWLYRATHNTQYLHDAYDYVEDLWAWALSWDDKKVACQLILYEETHDDRFSKAVVGFMQAWLDGINYTPCGLAWRDMWGANRYAANSAFVALLSAEAGINPSQYRKWAVEQMNYILGDNKHDGGCYSFQIGYGDKYPLQPHHRAASCPDRPANCSFAQLNAPGPSPHVLIGAIVGGPEYNDNYHDLRSDYILNEVATDYNSGFQGALAAIVHLQMTNNFPVTNNKCPCMV